MQKNSLFDTFLQKQRQLHQKIYQRQCLKDKSNFSHFEAVSNVNVINHQNIKSHLSLIQKQYLQCLKDYAHSQESFKQVDQKLRFIQKQVVNQQYKHAEHLQQLKKKLYQLDLENEVMQVKTQQSLEKIFQIKENSKKLQNILLQHQKIQEQKQEELQYQKCMNKEISNKNNQIFQCLEKKSFQISQATQYIDKLNQTSQQLQEKIKYQHQKIFQTQKIIQKLDNTLSNQTLAIQSLLNQQNDRINDIIYYKQTQENIQQKIQFKSDDILQAEQVEYQLKKIQENLLFQHRRCRMEIQVQEKGIDQQIWKIQKQKQMLNQNLLMFQGLRQYLSRLAQQNQMLQEILQKQIVEDHTIKLIVDSKCEYPVGYKTKVTINQLKNEKLQTNSKNIQCDNNNNKNSLKMATMTGNGVSSKTMMSTSTSWKNLNKNSQKQNEQLKALKLRNQHLMQKMNNSHYRQKSLLNQFYL